MAISQQNTEQTSPLEVNAQDYYFNTLRPYLEEMYKKCTTDEELGRTIEKLLNEADTACIRKDYAHLAEAFDAIEVGITDKNYFNGVMKKAPEAEKEMVRGLVEKITDIRTIIKYEPKQEPQQQAQRERLSYRPGTLTSPNGENVDFGQHNMSVLNKPEPKERIPNIN